MNTSEVCEKLEYTEKVVNESMLADLSVSV